MFHHWQPDLPAHLQFAASFIRFPFPWKHLTATVQPHCHGKLWRSRQPSFANSEMMFGVFWAIRPANLFTFQTNSRRVGYKILCDEPERTGPPCGRFSFFGSADAQTFAVAGSAGFLARARARSRHAARCFSQYKTLCRARGLGQIEHVPSSTFLS